MKENEVDTTASREKNRRTIKSSLVQMFGRSTKKSAALMLHSTLIAVHSSFQRNRISFSQGLLFIQKRKLGLLNTSTLL